MVARENSNASTVPNSLTAGIKSLRRSRSVHQVFPEEASWREPMAKKISCGRYTVSISRSILQDCVRMGALAWAVLNEKPKHTLFRFS